MSLKALIEAKTRRTASLPILVGDAKAADVEVATIRAALDVHLGMVKERRDKGEAVSEDDEARGVTLREQLAEAKRRRAATVVEVELQALEPDEWDAILDSVEDGPEGLDLSDIRPALIAASCVDEELRDAVWWEQQFARPEWSKGDLLAVNNVLLDLNLFTPAGAAGKG